MRKYIAYGREFFKRADMVLFFLCLACAILGIVVIHSATLTYESNRFVLVQSGSLVIGIILFVVLTVIDVDIIADQWKLLFGFEILLLLILAVFGVGMDESGN